MKLRAVAFDFDGTFYPESALAWRSLGFLAANFRLVWALDQARKNLRLLGRPVENFYEAQAQEVARLLNRDPKTIQNLIEQKIYTDWFLKYKQIRLFPGVHRVLNRFRQEKIPLAILSDFPIRDRLRDVGLLGWWDLVISSEDLGALKPLKYPFEALIQHFQLPPDEILYVGNSYTYDVLGGHSAGLRTAHLTTKPQPRSLADFQFSHYEDLQDFVLTHLAKQ